MADEFTPKETEKLFGASPSKSVAQVPQTRKPVSHVDTAQGFRNARQWVDSHVLPIAAWVGLVGLAIVGADTIFNHLSSSIRVAATIFVVAFLAFKLP